MLVDVPFRNPGGGDEILLSAIADVNKRNPWVTPFRVGIGLYLCTHWNPEMCLPRGYIVDFFSRKYQWPDYDEFGVCDHFEQPVRKWFLRKRPEKMFVTFVLIEKAAQEERGGWRWHKWGSYIGDQKPTREYIHDEPDIDQVYTYHIYEVAQAR